MRKTLSILFLFFTFHCFSQALTINNANILADGNSYVQGNGFTPFITYISQTAPFNSNGSIFSNFGVGGQTTPQMLSDNYNQVLVNYVFGRVNFLLVVEGGNDIYINGSVANAVANMKTYCNAARAAGFHVITTTLIHREQTTPFGDDPTTFNSKIDQYNTAVLADSSFYDRIIRPDLEVIFSTYTSAGYHTDHVHPNNIGQQKHADLFIAAIKSIVGNSIKIRGKKASVL